MRIVTMPDLMKELSSLLGELSVPTNGVDSRKTFLQDSLEDAWKYYPWPFTLTDTTLSFNSGAASLPDDFLAEGHYYLDDGVGLIDEVDYKDRLTTRKKAFYLSYESGTYVIRLLNTPDFTGNFRYQYVAPLLDTDDTLPAPYPSRKTLALGAIRYTVKADNPEADNSQEVATFLSALQDDMAPFNAAKRRRRKTQTYMSRAGYNIGEA